MAEGTAKDMKNRVKSIKNTRQITKAMELVASSRLKKAKEQIDGAAQYLKALQAIVDQVTVQESDNLFRKSQKNVNRTCHCIIAGDRGLAGGYNINLFKYAQARLKGDCLLLPIGKKTAEYFDGHYSFLSREYLAVSSLTGAICLQAGIFLKEQYQNGIFDTLSITYTEFINMLRQEPRTVQVLPIVPQNEKSKKREILYEPSPEAVLERILPDYIGAKLYNAVTQSYTSELCSRRNAMDAATRNADEMIETLTLQYNQARQSAITQEITEIAAGANVGGN